MKRNKKVLTAVVVALSLLIVGCGGFLLYKNLNEGQSEEEYGCLAASVMTQQSQTASGTSSSQAQTAADASTAQQSQTAASTVPAAPNPVDFPTLEVQNPDIYSWINIPNTQVDYPVLQSPDDDNFYLDHGVDKDYRFAGAIYSQRCNAKDYSDRVTVLYGHNMRNGSMFATLHWFSDPSFFAQNEQMTIYTDDRQLNYQIVAAYVYGDNHIMNSFDFNNDEVYRDFLDSVLNPHSIDSNVREGATLDISDRIVILSTCLNYGDGRYLVVGKLTGESPLA